VEPSTYTFPFPDQAFSFVIVTSVFTHMLPDAVEHYLDEIARVLQPGGTLFATFFLVNPESRQLMEDGVSTMTFHRPVSSTCFTTDPGDPEAAVAFLEGHVMQLLAARGLRVSQPIQYGSWCGRERFLSYQDIIIARL
jgi:ubiquinone/menaquinone biosynthesis C-methylase UbiE